MSSKLITNHYPKVVVHSSFALLTVAFLAFSHPLAAQDTPSSSPNAPKLLDAIADQTLFLDEKSANRPGPVAGQRIYFRDLHVSFGDMPNESFSAYPYNKTIADAWVVDNYLIVLARAVGTAKIAVTASNEFGSMIDWFVVNVEAKRDSAESERDVPQFEANLSSVRLSEFASNAFQLPKLNTVNSGYALVPKLPASLAYDRAGHYIRGQLDSALPNEPFYWIAITPTKEIAIQQFKLELKNPSSTRAPSAIALTEALNLDINDTIAVWRRNASLDSMQLGAPAGDTAIPIAASRPAPVLLPRTTVDGQYVLSGFTNALQSRFRNIEHAQDRGFENSHTVWQYASSRPSNNAGDKSMSNGVEPGIYVGFDTRVGTNLTTGLAFGLESQSPAEAARTRSLFANASALNFSSVMPYASWYDDAGRHVWGSLGVARDFPFNQPFRAEQPVRGNLNLVVGTVGWRQVLASSGNIQVASIGDAGLALPLAPSDVENTPDLLQPSAARSLRTGFEMSYDGKKLRPYVGLSGRVHDLSLFDAGIEALGGIQFTSFNGLTLSAEGRALNYLAEADDSEWIFSVAAHLDPGLQGQGLAVSFAPTYGANDRLFGYVPSQRYIHGFNQFGNSSPLEDQWSMSGTLSYGLPLSASGQITPFGQISISTLNQTRMGFRVALNSNLDRLFDMEIATRQMRIEEEHVDQGVDIQLRVVF